MSLPREGDVPAAMAHSFVMSAALSSSDAFGSDEHAASMDSVFSGWIHRLRQETAVWCAFDEQHSDLPGECASLPLGIDPKLVEVPGADPGVQVLPLGWVEVSRSLDAAENNHLTFTLVLGDSVLPLPGQPLSQTAKDTLSALVGVVDQYAAQFPEVMSVETWVDLGASPDPADNPVASWLCHRGFELGLREHVSHLPVPESPLQIQLPSWQGNTVEMCVFDQVIPPERFIPSLLQLYQQAEDEVPHGDMTVTRMTWDRALLEELDAACRAAGRAYGGVLFAAGDEVLAVSVFGQTPASQPHIASQGLTMVRHDARGRGVGLAVKKAALNAVAVQLPQVRKVMTNNAGVNAGILAINSQLGMVVEGYSAGFIRSIPAAS